MCGIIVSVALKRQGPSQVNGHVRPYTNGDANATSYGHVNGDLPNGTAKGHHPPPELSGRKTLEEQLNKSLDLIAHRGPDAKGIWIDESGNVGTFLLLLLLSCSPTLSTFGPNHSSSPPAY